MVGIGVSSLGGVSGLAPVHYEKAMNVSVLLGMSFNSEVVQLVRKEAIRMRSNLAIDTHSTRLRLSPQLLCAGHLYVGHHQLVSSRLVKTWHVLINGSIQ